MPLVIARHGRRMIASSQPTRTSADAGWHAFAASMAAKEAAAFKAAQAWHL